MDQTRSRLTRVEPPNERGFVHKRIFGAVKGGLGGLLGGPGGIIGGATRGFLGGGGGGSRDRDVVPLPRSFRGGAPIARVQPRAAVPQGSGCPPGFFLQNGQCVQSAQRVVKTPGLLGFGQRLIPGGATGFEVEGATVTPSVTGDFGEAVMGRFGAALEPAIRMTDVRVCPRGTVLGMDGLCYNRRDIRNAERFWPRGRRPLLTGGEMRCITIAASAAKKLKTKQKQLETLGLLKRPAPRRRLPPGHSATLTHGSDH